LTDIPLTANGEETIRALGKRIAGPGRILDPAHIKKAFVSPRARAQKTFQLLFESCPTGVPEYSLEEGVREWEYGVAEGKVTKDIKKELGENWQIWDDGCPEGESAQQMSDRCDEMIKKIVDLTS
jgi:probable phosphoglycerate mutase